MSLALFCVYCLLCAFSPRTFAYDDLLVAVENKLELLTHGLVSQQIPLTGFNATKLSVLAYDPSAEKLFFSDRRHSRGHIFSVDMDFVGRTGSVQDLVEKSTNESVEGMTYDPISHALIWADGLKQSIRKIKVGQQQLEEESSSGIEVVHFLADDRPNGVVIDPCSRMLYWTNRNMEHPTIERSHLNGTGREVIVQKDLLIPQGLSIDVKSKKLYWANNLRMGYFHIERSNLDGTSRELVYRGIGQFVFSLTVGGEHIYWTDWDHKTVWALPKDATFDQPVALRHYPVKPMAVVLFQHQPLNCETKTAVKKSEDSESNQPAITDDTDNLCAGFCYNNGECLLIENDYRCRCPVPFTGERCELIEGLNEAQKPAAAWGCPEISDIRNGTVGQTEIIVLFVLSMACAILLTIVLLLSIRLSKLLIAKQRRTIGRRCSPSAGRQTSSELSVVDIENCCQTISLCERPCLQQPAVVSIGKEPSKWSNDKAKLLRNES